MTNKRNYHEWVYELVRMIPAGQVTTYGDIADYLSLGSARMVGYALRQLSSYSFSDPVPAHRVVNSNGVLTGKRNFRTPSLMEELLISEGVEIKDDRIINFENKRWRPQFDN